MRKKFLFFVLVPLLSLTILLYFFLDSWVEAGLEAAGEAAVGAKVEIDNLRLSLSPIGMEFSRLQVANPRDPWKNTFETGVVRFALDFGQLLRSKFIIETIEMHGLVFGTARTTDGALPRKSLPPPRPAESQQLSADAPLAQQAEALAEEKKKATPVFDLDGLRKQLNLDSLLNTRNLRSVGHIDSLRNQVGQVSRQWESILADAEKSKQRAVELEGKIKAINVSELKNVEALSTALKNLADVQQGIKDINQTLTSRRAAVTEDVNRLAASVRVIDDLAQQDFRDVLQLARLPDVNMQGLAEILLGKDLMAGAYEYLSWVDFARTHVQNSTSKPANANPPRMKGQNISFPSEKSYPKFWIKKIAVSGGMEKDRDPKYFYAAGIVQNISSNQRATGLPLTIDLTAIQGRGTNAEFKASLDRTGDIPLDTYRASLSGVPLASLSLGRSDFVPSKISNAVARFAVAVDVPGNRFDANANMAFTNLNVSFDRTPKNTVERLVQEVLQSIQRFSVILRFWKTGEKLDVAFETDLDNLLAEKTRKVIGDEVRRLTNELRQKLDRKIAEKRREVEELFNQKKQEMTSRLRAYENLLNEKLAFAEAKKKELEERIQGEKKKQEDALKKKGADALKGLLKKKN